MSTSSTQNDLQSVEEKSNQAPASVEIIAPSPETRINIEYTASLVSKCGLWIESRIMANFGNNVDNTIFFFLRSSNIFHAYYQHKLSEFRNAQSQDIQPDAETMFSFKEQPLEPRTLQLFRLKELGIIKLTAQFVVRYGKHFWRDLMYRVMKDPLFAFMEPSDSSFSLFTRLIHAYARVLKPYQKKLLKKPGAVLESFFNLLREKLQEEGVETHAFVGGLDYFAGREDKELPPPGDLPMVMDPPTQMQPGVRAVNPFRDPLPELTSFPLTYPEGITPKELAIFKLTAQFSTRWTNFLRDLKKRVIDDPRFEFLKSTSDRSYLFYFLIGAYARVLRPCPKLREPGACTETVVEGFLNLLRREQQEEGDGVEMAMIELNAFVGSREDEELSPPPGHLSTQMQSNDAKPLNVIKLTMQAPLGSKVSPRPGMSRPPPDPKRQKFLAQPLGSSTIRVSVPNAADGQVIEIAVQSLSENVASLKEKIAGEIQIPASKQKLCGKAGVLKDNMPLAHYNVGSGETLTLSL